jgi:hypothetical protein
VAWAELENRRDLGKKGQDRALTRKEKRKIRRKCPVRNALFALTAVLVVMTVVSSKSPAEECMIGDSALCLADPKCHWDGERRGCYPGPAPFRDACAAHEDKGICATSSVGCQWSEADNKCVSKAQ